MSEGSSSFEISKEILLAAVSYFKKRRLRTETQKGQARRILANLLYFIRDIKNAILAYDQWDRSRKSSGFIDFSSHYYSFQDSIEGKKNVTGYTDKLKSYNIWLAKSGFYSKAEGQADVLTLLFEGIRSVVAHSTVYLKRPNNETLSLFLYQVEQVEDLLTLICKRYALDRIK